MILFCTVPSSTFVMHPSLKYSFTLCILILVFVAYNIVIYTSDKDYGTIHLSNKAQQGEKLWLQNNCNSCHQLYGLGGYLGPDLTNEYSRRNNEKFLKAMLNSGIKTMPKFNLSDSECSNLIQFLKEIDKTGYYPNPEAGTQNNGWVNLKYKNATYEK